MTSGLQHNKYANNVKAKSDSGCQCKLIETDKGKENLKKTLNRERRDLRRTAEEGSFFLV